MNYLPITAYAHVEGNGVSLLDGVQPMRVLTHDIFAKEKDEHGHWHGFDLTKAAQNLSDWYIEQHILDYGLRVEDTLCVVDVEQFDPVPPVKDCHEFLTLLEDFGFRWVSWYLWYDTWLKAMYRKRYWKHLLSYSDKLSIAMFIHRHDFNLANPIVELWCHYAAHFDRPWIAATIPWSDKQRPDGTRLRDLPSLALDLRVAKRFGASGLGMFIPRHMQTVPECQPWHEKTALWQELVRRCARGEM